MKPFTTGLIFFNLLFGGVVGFISIITNDQKILALVQVMGLLLFTIEIFAILPDISLRSNVELLQATEQTANSIENIILALVSYTFGNVAFGIGAGIFIGNKGRY